MSRMKRLCNEFPLFSQWTMKVHSCTNRHVYGCVPGRNGQLIVPRRKTTSHFVGDEIRVQIVDYAGVGVVRAIQE